ncbi:MAG: iron-sulfur cluster assembly scaffold protein [Sphingomonas sp.]|nr:iron-sulfur cluster assembly scaffold protein [Sphingomonas sp.]
MNAPTYTTDILRLAASLAPPTALEHEDGRAELRSPTCGSSIRTMVTVDGEGRVVALSQDVRACAFGQASAALVGRDAAGRTGAEIAIALGELADWLGGTRADPGRWPGLSALAPARSKTGRHGAIMLPFRALLAALDDAR